MPEDPLKRFALTQLIADHVQRAAYDRYGSSGPSQPSFSNGDPDLDDLFAHMFGFGGASASFDPFSGAGPSSHRPRKGRDTDVRYEISLEEAFKGKRVIMNLSRDRTCGVCAGQGGRKGAKKDTCGRCKGKGKVIQDRHVSHNLVVLRCCLIPGTE